MKQHEMVHINAPVVARLTPEGLSRLEAYYNDLGVPYPPPWLHGDELCTQFAVCRKNGTYNEEVRSKWVDQAPQGFEQRPVIMADKALPAFQGFQAARTEEQPKKAVAKKPAAK
jgi:hypothetical protein